MAGERFAQLIERAHLGETDALETLLDEYGDAIRREIRFCLLDNRLKQVVGESDIYQSVVTRFVVRLRDGDFEFDRPQDLVNLLKSIARAHVAQLARFWRAQRRDVRRNVSLVAETSEQHVTGDPTPSSVVGRAELVQQVNKRLAERDRTILQWREDRVGWAEIAHRLDATSLEAVRKQHERAMERVAKEFRFED